DDQQSVARDRASLSRRARCRQGDGQGVGVVRHKDAGHRDLPVAQLDGLWEVQRHDPGEIHAYRALARVSRLRWPLRVYILCVLGAALAALPASAAFREDLRPTDTVLFALLMAAATAFLLIAGPGAQVVREPWAIAIAAIAKYLVNSAFIDLVVALQVRRNPLGGWWTLHRRLLPYEAALLVLGALAGIAAQAQPWTLVLFGVPMAIV